MGDLNAMEFIIRLAPALAAVALLPLAALWLQRRKRGTRQQPIRVTNRTPMGRNTWMAVVEVEGRRLLVATNDRGVNMLTELEPAPEGASALDEMLSSATEDDGGPRMGLIRRLQDRTLRQASTGRPQFELES